MELDVTVAIPVFNGIKVLPVVMDRLGTPDYTGLTHLEVLLLDNGSMDGSLQYAETIVRHKWFKFLNVRSEKQPQRPGGGMANIPMQRRKLAELTKTKYIHYLNQDIVMRPFALIQLFEDFVTRPNCGALSIKYDPKTNHVESGCTLMETEVARKVEWGFTPQSCDCWHLNNSLDKMGLKMEYQENTNAFDVHFR